MRAVYAALLAALLAVPARAQRVVAPLRAPTLPGGALPTALAPLPTLSAAPPLVTPVLPAPATRPLLPAVPTPVAQAAAVPASAAGLAEVAAQARESAAPSPAFSPLSAALFDGSARPAPSAVPASLPTRNGARDLEPSGFRGDLQGDQGAVAEPGSIFGWRPWDQAPTHGLPFVDRWVARAFDSKARAKDPGFEFQGAPTRAAARVFLYGETHSDKGLIERNMRALAADMDPEKAGLVLVEGYLGPDLHGTEAVLFLERRGLDADLLAARGVDFSRVRVRGWDEPASHDASTPLVLRHHMELLALNHLTHDGKGLLYYPRLAAQAARTALAWVRMRAAAIGLRNAVLDASVADAVARMGQAGGTVHVVSGSEHFLEKPTWLSRPLGRARLRRGLAAVLAGVPYWAEKPAESR